MDRYEIMLKHWLAEFIIWNKPSTFSKIIKPIGLVEQNLKKGSYKLIMTNNYNSQNLKIQK